MVTAIILCGGLGTRMASVAARTPKVLLPIGGKPFLWYLLQHLQRHGIARVVLSTGHLGDQVANFVQDGTRWQMELRCVQESTPLGTGGAVRLAADTLQLKEPLLVLNGDTFFSGPPALLKTFHDSRPDSRGSLALARVPNAARYGRVNVHVQSGAVERFVEKGRCEARAAWINAGMYILESDLVDSIPSNRAVSLEQQVFPDWVGRGLYGCRVEGALFLDLGTPGDYARAPGTVKQFLYREGR